MMELIPKVHRETCEHCQFREIPNGCDGCLAGIAYDCEDERRRRIYYKEYGALGRRFKEMCDIRDAKYYKFHGRRI